MDAADGDDDDDHDAKAACEEDPDDWDRSRIFAYCGNMSKPLG